jgi:hypothetical protein
MNAQLTDTSEVLEPDRLEPGDHVSADDQAAAERDQQVNVGQGDLVFIRFGHRLRRFQLGP